MGAEYPAGAGRAGSESRSGQRYTPDWDGLLGNSPTGVRVAS
jgi:hypothetical protein